ncbi:MAG: polyhydroxyalkanoate synthesis repressor PhaR [Pseudomonadota bacterium]
MADVKKPGRRANAAGDTSASRVVIKKYANRRLYNTARSTYVTLEDLAKMVRGGEDFAVFDAKTGEEITRSVLTQIIFEEEAKGQQMLPTNFLRQLIRLYGDTLQSVVPSYLDASMNAFARNQEQMRTAFASNPAMQNFEALTRSNMELFEQAMRMYFPFAAGRGGPLAGAKPNGAAGEPAAAEATNGSAAAGDPAQPGAAGSAPGSGSGAASDSDLDSLQRQLREMQSQIEKLSRERP